MLLERFLPQLGWEHPNEVRTSIRELLLLDSPVNDPPLSFDELAVGLSFEDLARIIHHSPVLEHQSFRGKFYTLRRGGSLEHKGSSEEVELQVRNFLKSHGKKGYALLKALLELQQGNPEAVSSRSKEVNGERFNVSPLLKDLKDMGLVIETGSRDKPRWSIPGEIRPPVSEVLAEIEEKPVPHLTTPQAEREFIEVIRMEEEFRSFLQQVVEERIEETVHFGKTMCTNRLVEYLQQLYGPVLFYDHLLSLAQQYSICDAEVVGEKGYQALSTGFNLALFGEPGTGKTFAVKDMVVGNQNLGVPPHGLPGINRYCGGMTPAMFIAIGEAYTHRKFNFIITEFNDWFKYSGMVEPLKLAMERATIRYETKSYTVGPYVFGSFFGVNYNTRVHERGYQATVRDPNFNAIEDRMLCRLHRLTKEKYRELARSQRELMLGQHRNIMQSIAPQIRDHLVLVYASQTGDSMVKDRFTKKRILLSKSLVDKLSQASNLVLEHIGTDSVVPFSMRLERRALQLAGSLALLGSFSIEADLVHIDSEAERMAIRFFVEEAWVRSNEHFPLEEVLKKLSVHESVKLP